MCDKQREYFVFIVTCVDKTLWSAANIRVSDVILDTPAGSGSVSGGTLGVGSTWRGIAGVHWVWPGHHFRGERTA